MKKYLAIYVLMQLLISGSLSAYEPPLFPPILAIMDSAMQNFSAPGLGKDSQDYADASAEGSHFIALLDQQQYRNAWNDAGSILKELVPMEIWTEGVRFLRGAFGQTSSRKLIKHESMNAISGGLTGNFYRILYRTQFYGEGTKEETLILMNEELDRWRVISYSLN